MRNQSICVRSKFVIIQSFMRQLFERKKKMHKNGRNVSNNCPPTRESIMMSSCDEIFFLARAGGGSHNTLQIPKSVHFRLCTITLIFFPFYSSINHITNLLFFHWFLFAKALRMKVTINIRCLKHIYTLLC